LISEPIHTSREKLSTKEMLIKIADSALQINRCIEEYNDDHYDDQEMLYENAAGIAYGTAFLRKNSKTKEICDIEGQGERPTDRHSPPPPSLSLPRPSIRFHRFSNPQTD